MDYRNLKTVKQIAELNPAFSEAALRWIRFNAETNGFESAFVKVGRRVLIDLTEFEERLEDGRLAKTGSGDFAVEKS